MENGEQISPTKTVTVQAASSQAVVDILAGAGIDAVRRGWQLATFLQSDDPALQLAPVAAQSVAWNPKEWLNAKRGL